MKRDMRRVEADAEMWSVALQLQAARTESNAAPF